MLVGSVLSKRGDEAAVLTTHRNARRRTSSMLLCEPEANTTTAPVVRVENKNKSHPIQAYIITREKSHLLFSNGRGTGSPTFAVVVEEEELQLRLL